MKTGDTVKVHVRVKEGDKERIQVFEGIIIGLRRGGNRATFTVRKVSFSQGVERIFPLHSPTISKVEIVRSAKVRRAKLYFLRDLKGKAVLVYSTFVPGGRSHSASDRAGIFNSDTLVTRAGAAMIINVMALAFLVSLAALAALFSGVWLFWFFIRLKFRCKVLSAFHPSLFLATL